MNSELEEIKQAFEKWREENGDYEMYLEEEVAEMFWPLLELYYARQADPSKGVYADETRAVYALKWALGMELRAHEQSGVGDD